MAGRKSLEYHYGFQEKRGTEMHKWLCRIGFPIATTVLMAPGSCQDDLLVDSIRVGVSEGLTNAVTAATEEVVSGLLEDRWRY